MNWRTFPKQVFDRFQTNFGQTGKSQSEMVTKNAFSLQT